ncbi:hypothetical protein SKAU_G00027210 [Synaphobranchus kaupii]|uniref:Uncharacterized protein n=1 Tax=Synaphobranchus kaupii TaxID=118154 RepID=A0A9Q1JDQ2_SYNKA|nr:hypothetical protein SKAU_G00027210 [Synaphobranchus kaupii]
MSVDHLLQYKLAMMDSADSSQLKSILDRQGVLLGRHQSQLDSVSKTRDVCCKHEQPVSSVPTTPAWARDHFIHPSDGLPRLCVGSGKRAPSTT